MSHWLPPLSHSSGECFAGLFIVDLLNYLYLIDPWYYILEYIMLNYNQSICLFFNTIHNTEHSRKLHLLLQKIHIHETSIIIAQIL